MKVLLIIFTLSISCKDFANYNKKEVALEVASFPILQSDSISIKYLEAKKLYEKEKYTDALELSLKIIKSSNKIESDNLISINHLIANILFDTRNNKNSITYFKKNLDYIKEYRLKNEITNFKASELRQKIVAESFLTLGTLYSRLYTKEKVRKFKDSAYIYYNRVGSLEVLQQDVLNVKARAFTNLSVILMNDSIYGEAKDYALKSIKIHKKLNSKVNEAGALGNLSSIYLLEGDFNQAKQIYFDAIDLIKNINTNKALEVREYLYYNLAYNLYKLKDYKAYDYQELSYNIKDSIRDKQFREIIAEINEKYNFDVKKGLILQEEENKRLRDQRTFWIVGIVAILVIFSLLYWLNYFKLKQTNLGLELSQTQLLQNQKIEKIKSESQIRILNATIDGKESERKQIAETLHDSVSALLSSANLHLQATKSQFNGKTPIEIEKTRSIITEASHKIRDLSHTLVSSVLLKFGLEFAINDMATKYSNSQIEVNTAISGVRRYHQSFEIKVYNIIQEFVNNILKHSQASIAKINLREEDKILYFEISDNGVGFDQTKVSNKDGLGINQIEARITVMKGKFTIDSSVGKGTKIQVEIPVLEKEITNLV